MIPSVQKPIRLGIACFALMVAVTAAGGTVLPTASASQHTPTVKKPHPANRRRCAASAHLNHNHHAEPHDAAACNARRAPRHRHRTHHARTTKKLQRPTTKKLKSPTTTKLTSPTSSSAATPTLPSSWTPLDEPGVGGRVSALSISPANANNVLVGGDMLGIGLSQDGGHTWQPTTGLSSWEVNDFTWSPTDPATVWAGTLSGPYKSTDGGHTWTSMRVGMSTQDYPYSAPVQKVLIDPSNPSHLLAFGGNQSEFRPGGPASALDYGVVYRSTDAGAHWSTLSTIDSNDNIVDVATAGPNLNTVYVATRFQGIFKSTDGGQPWTPVNNGLPSPRTLGLAIDPSNANTLWVAMDHSPTLVANQYAPGGIYKTADGGHTWSPANHGLPQNADASASNATSMFSVFRAGDGTLYTADQGYDSQARFKSTDGGATWTPAGGYFAKAFPAEATPYVWSSSANGSLVVGGTSDTIMGSTDHGQTWQDMDSNQLSDGSWQGHGFSGLLGTSVTFDPELPTTMFLTAFDSGNLLRSTNAGSSWTRPLAPYDQWDGSYGLAAGGRSGNVVYTVLGQAGMFNGIGVSTNSGQTWQVHYGDTLPARWSGGSARGSVTVASADGSVAYAVLPDGALYKTTDEGASWTAIPLGTAAWAVSSAPDFSTTYVSTDNGVFQIGLSGAPQLMPSSPHAQAQVVVAPGGAVYTTGQLGASASSAGLWRYTGGSWTNLSGNDWVSDVAVDPNQPRRVVFTTNNNPYHTTSFATGVWVSCDNGSTFTQYNPGLAMNRVMSVAFNPRIPGRAVIGTNGRGFWQAQLPAC